MKTETERLILREMGEEDFEALYGIFSDEATMAHYPSAFDEKKVHEWISWNKENYAVFGFGLWAVVLKECGRVIGDCGVTMQFINGRIKPEIGYHINKDYWNRGLASEAARAVRDYIFVNTPFNALYSYMKYTNKASSRVAQKCGMTLCDVYEDKTDIFTEVYSISREKWERLREGQSKE
ncbi:MAG: GNAT family N-acetyltransferase [Eubacteriaceae bacterium]|nr:GNAT family N-acetyltransferase [Eubacteriaceae bacterium]